MNELAEELFKLYENGELCDATLVPNNGGGEGAPIHVHKLVLATKSGYFRARFFGNFASNKVELEYNEDVLKAIVTYCYTGQLDIDNTLLRRFCYTDVRDEPFSSGTRMKKSSWNRWLSFLFS